MPWDIIHPYVYNFVEIVHKKEWSLIYNLYMEHAHITPHAQKFQDLTELIWKADVSGKRLLAVDLKANLVYHLNIHKGPSRFLTEDTINTIATRTIKTIVRESNRVDQILRAYSKLKIV